MKEELEIYARGDIYCSICTNIEDPKRIEELVNKKYLKPLSRWKISGRKNFRSGIPNPCACDKKGKEKTHMHYLMET